MGWHYPYPSTHIRKQRLCYLTTVTQPVNLRQSASTVYIFNSVFFFFWIWVLDLFFNSYETLNHSLFNSKIHGYKDWHKTSTQCMLDDSSSSAGAGVGFVDIIVLFVSPILILSITDNWRESIRCNPKFTSEREVTEVL